MNIKYENFFQKLIDVVPEFNDIFWENIQIYETAINHVFMGDFFPFFMDTYRTYLQNGSSKSFDAIQRSLQFLEDAMSSSDDRIRDLISLSFLEGFPPEKSCPGLRRLIGPRLREELNKYEYK